ncbi:MAG: divergent polysaccharide deacetylase family protein [Proteobacteria bacterium]|nr:divergent polysaccharide deacetylase family protein [Pseudomonadota bacterium]
MLAGLGLSQSATKAAIQQLPGSVTLGFAPYARGLEAWMNEARAAGHEVFLELPMEPFDYPDSDPGPHTLLTTLDHSDNIDRLDWLLSRTSGYVGVTNFMGDKFTSSPESLVPVLEALRDRGLMFLDARTSRESVAGDLATQIELPRALNNRFLDNEASRIAIDARLLELEEIAKTVGYAVGIGFPYPVTLERIARWSATLDAKGIDLAPMSALADMQTE